MSDELSQAKIDSLLTMFNSGSLVEERGTVKGSEASPKAYDFKEAMGFSKEQIDRLVTIHSEFGRLFEARLRRELHTRVQIQVQSEKQDSFEKFLESVHAWTIFHTFDFSPFRGPIAIGIHPEIIFTMLDLLLGGTGRGPYSERPLTDIEHRLVRSLLGTMAEDFTTAWQSVDELVLRSDPSFTSGQMLQITPPHEVVLWVTLDVRIGDTVERIWVCIPHCAIEPVRHRLHSISDNKQRLPSDIQPKGSVTSLHTHLEDIQVPIQVLLGTTDMNLDNVLGLQVGDIISLGKTTEDPLTVVIDDVPAFTASLGEHEHRYAVKVVQCLKGGNSRVRPDEIVTGRD